jgi:anthranilate 1,2-dioxygenase small subunit
MVKASSDIEFRIQALHADYAHCVDDDRLEEWPDFFTADGRYRVVTRENHALGLPLSLIYCDGKGMLADRISAMRTANVFEPHTYCHMTAAPRVTKSIGNEHHVRANFSVIRTMSDGEMSVFACGKYLDRVVEVGGRLLLAERTVVLDSRRIDTLLVIPL